MWLLFLFGLPAALFVVPCLLPWRWLCAYTPLAALGFGLVWQNNLAHRGEGNGAAEALGMILLLSWTATAIGGVLARLAILALRTWHVRWRYAWLPAPIILALLIASPWLVRWYHDFKFRPPSEECLSQRHPILLGEARFDLPLAPILAVQDSDGKHHYYFHSNPSARAFCAAARGRKQPIKASALVLNLKYGWEYYQRKWPETLCRHASEWMRQFCTAPTDPRVYGFPDEARIIPATQLSRSATQMLLLLQRARAATETREIESSERDVRQWLLRTSAGFPMALACRYFQTEWPFCEAIYEAAPGFLVVLRGNLPKAQIPAGIVEAQNTVAAILSDLGPVK